MEANFLEKYNAAVGLVPVDLNDGANTGARISMKDARRITFLFALGASTAAVLNISLKQHDAYTSGSTKALSIGNPYYVKAGAAEVFTKVVPNAATDNYVLTTQFAADGGIVAFEVLAEDLDTNEGFGWISLNCIDTTAAKVGAVLAVVETKGKPAYEIKHLGT